MYLITHKKTGELVMMTHAEIVAKYGSPFFHDALLGKFPTIKAEAMTEH